MAADSWLDKYHLRERLQQLDEELLYHPDPDPPPAPVPWGERPWFAWSLLGLILVYIALLLYTSAQDATLRQQARARAAEETQLAFSLVAEKTRLAYFDGVRLGQKLILCPELHQFLWSTDFLNRAVVIRPQTCEAILQLLVMPPPEEAPTPRQDAHKPHPPPTPVPALE